MKRFHACCPSHATSRVANRISVRLLWTLADFSYCFSRFTVRVSFLPHSDLCSSSEMASLPHGCILICTPDIILYNTVLHDRTLENGTFCGPLPNLSFQVSSLKLLDRIELCGESGEKRCWSSWTVQCI